MKNVQALVIAFAVCAGADGIAQSYPVRPVRIIVPVTAGSGLDIVTRTVGQKLSEQWGQPVIVDNRSGAGGSLGSAVASKATPDGYTLLAHSSAFAIGAKYYAAPPYDALRDFVAVAPIGKQPYVLVVGPSAGVKSVTELIAMAKAKPGALNFGSAGSGSGTHMAAEKFRLSAGIDVVHVPYKGGPEATTDTMTGRVTFWFPPVALALPFVQSGKLIALGVSSSSRSSLLPNVPTLAQSGLANFEDAFWNGTWAPAGTPADVVQRIASDITRASQSADLRDRLLKVGVEPMVMSQQEFAQLVRSEIDATSRVMQLAGIKPQ